MKTPKNDKSSQPKLSVKEYVEQIKGSWQESVKSILATAKICANADGALTDDEKKALLKQIADRMGANEHSMMVQIGKDKRFDDPQVQALLPPAYSVMYELTRWKDGPFRELIKKGGALPSRSELQKLRKGSDDPAPDDEQYVGRLLAPADLTGEDLDDAVAAVEASAVGNRLKFVLSRERAENRKNAKQVTTSAAAREGAPGEENAAAPAPARDAEEGPGKPAAAPKAAGKRLPKKAPVKPTVVGASSLKTADGPRKAADSTTAKTTEKPSADVGTDPAQDAPAAGAPALADA